MATVSSVKQKILDKIEVLVDSIVGSGSDDAVTKLDGGKAVLMGTLINSYIRLGNVFVAVDDDDEDEDDEDDVETDVEPDVKSEDDDE